VEELYLRLRRLAVVDAKRLAMVDEFVTEALAAHDAHNDALEAAGMVRPGVDLDRSADA
jgi:hypothetical protein